MYTLDHLGRIGFAEPIIAAGDREAIAKARTIALNATRCEVWKDNRLVASMGDGELAS